MFVVYLIICYLHIDLHARHHRNIFLSVTMTDIDEAEDTIDQFMSKQGRKPTRKKTKKKVSKNKHPDNIYNVFCDLCDYVTYRRFHLVKHRRKVHDLDHNVKLNIKFNFSCTECDFKSKNVGVMERHKKAGVYVMQNTMVGGGGRTLRRTYP